MAKKVSKKQLGKGIGALLSNIENEVNENPQKVVKELSSGVATLPVASIEVNPFQPRTEFDETALKELADSISIHGLIQPITVRRLNKDSYQLISGERRLRASKLAGIEEVPAYVRIANDQEMLEMALVENIQRQDLNAIEIAITYERLRQECRLTHDDLAERVGKNRSTVTNYLRLLKLVPDIQKAIKEREISMGHARALLSAEDDPALQIAVLTQIKKQKLSVRAVEQLIRSHTQKGSPKKNATSPTLPEAYKKIQEDLRSHFGTKVTLKRSQTGKGQIVLNFSSDDELNRLLDLLEEN